MSAELCFNLWQYLTSRQTIAGISARAYLLDGSEDFKSGFLYQLSHHDFSLAPVHLLPASIRGRFDGGDVHYSALRDLGVEAVFAEVFEELRRSVPSSVRFPSDKLYFATPLFDFGDGFVPAEIGDGFVRARPTTGPHDSSEKHGPA